MLMCIWEIYSVVMHYKYSFIERDLTLARVTSALSLQSIPGVATSQFELLSPSPSTGKICRFGIFMEIPPFACFELLKCTFIYANVYMGNLFSSFAL